MEMTLEQVQPQLEELISQRKNFVIIGLSGNLTETVKLVESAIERQGLSCRVYTKNRLAAAFAGSLFFGEGLVAMAGIAIHNVATRNPDYEIARSIINNRLYVDYKK